VRKRTKDKLIAILILVGLVGSGAVLGAVVSGVIWKIKEARLNHELRNLKKDLENLQKRLQKNRTRQDRSNRNSLLLKGMRD